jgi:hypothetical protein
MSAEPLGIGHPYSAQCPACRMTLDSLLGANHRYQQAHKDPGKNGPVFRNCLRVSASFLFRSRVIVVTVPAFFPNSSM